MPRVSRLTRDEGGQALPFLLVWIVLAIVLIAMTVNVGQAASRRTGLQLLADAGAYTGASTMAVGLNALARISHEAIQLWESKKPLFSFPIQCSVSDEAVPVYDQLAADLGRAYDRLNANWQSQPATEARRVSTFNLYDLFPGERHNRFTLSETDRRLGVRLQRDAGVLVRSTRDVDRHDWVCLQGYYPQARVHYFAKGFARVDDNVLSFAWVVRAPAGVAMLASSFFGPLAVPPMGAAAVAKPIGGSIANGDARYIAKMVPLESIGVTSVRDGVPRATRPITH